MERLDVSQLNKTFNVNGPSYIWVTNDDCEPMKVGLSSSNSRLKIKKKNIIMSVEKDDRIIYERKVDNPYKKEIDYINELLINLEQQKRLEILNKKKEHQELIKYQEELKVKLFNEYNRNNQLGIEIKVSYKGLSYLKSDQYLSNIKRHIIYEKIDYLIYQEEFVESVNKKEIVEVKPKKQKRKYNALDDYRKILKKPKVTLLLNIK